MNRQGADVGGGALPAQGAERAWGARGDGVGGTCQRLDTFASQTKGEYFFFASTIFSLIFFEYCF